MAFLLGLAQAKHPEDGNVVGMVDRWAAQAKSEGVDLLVFPESLMTRYEAELGDFLSAAEPTNGSFASALDAIAAKYGLWIIYTMNELNPDGKPFNTIICTDADGIQRGKYRKVHLFDTDFTHESDRMGKGDALVAPIETPFGRIGMAICYDLRFPEVARFAALRGCDLLVYAAAWVDGPLKAHHWKTLITARAIENECFVAGLSRPDKGYIGRSIVASPLGETVAEAGPEECLLVAEIDPSAMVPVRANMPVFEHRRPQLYD